MSPSAKFSTRSWKHITEKRLKEKIIEQARAIYARKYADCDPAKGCLYWAAAFQEAARQNNIDALIQAGSAQFQFRADSDGVSDTHFSYMFDPTEAAMRLGRGLWPEIHVWNAIRATGELVDLSTGYQAEQAKNLCGFVWEKEFALPSYYWDKPSDQRIIYRADMKATILCLAMLKQSIVGDRNRLDGISRSANMSCERKR
jgi:hypothetical protein